MIQWLFDKRNQHGFLPNLIKDETLEPNTSAWWDLCINPPFSYEFRFLKYCQLDGVVQHCTLVNDYISGTASAYYPINLNFFDPDIDYIALMDDRSLQRFKSGDFRVLFYYSEGDNPNPEINNSLDRMCATHSVSKDSIRFVIANYKLKDTLPFVYFPDDELYYRYLHVIEDDYVKTQNLQSRDKKFTCLIRADKAWRKIYAAMMYSLDVTSTGYFSYTGYKYETSHKGVDDLSKWNKYDDTLVQDLLSFEMKTPIKCDELSDSDHNNHKLINPDYFQNAYWNFVVETHFDNDTIFLTEKTFKPILNLQPFIIVGNPYSLKLLESLGYQTFTDVIRETYDLEEDHKERMSSLLKMSFDLCNLSDKHHLRIQSIIADTLEHNQKVFLSPKVHRINNLLNKLEYHV
tara:strand:+ start:8830 stop:10041 length:1212 start_codon:yes stop_codon:yes gene_type:complete